MRIFKPLQLSLLTNSFSWEKKHYLSVTVLLGFPFDKTKDTLLEQDLWNLISEQLGKDAMIDMCMPKPQGEVVMYGSFHAPNKTPVTAGHVQLKIGTVNKTLSVIGDRYWRTLLAPTAPEKFTQLPLDYTQAFGGTDHAFNPIGKGIAPIDYFGEMRTPLPNIEYPDNLVTSPNQRPKPAGFAPLDIAWKKRTSKAGTYDEKWRTEYFPAPPPDLNWEIYNVTEEDQWIPNFWLGNEPFEITNAHKDKAVLMGELPAFRSRCVVAKEIDDVIHCTEVDMCADTVILLPEVETGVMVFRGSIEVTEDDATDIDHILVAYEDLDLEGQSFEYYQQALNHRLDEQKVFKYMMTSQDIIPNRETCGFKQMIDHVDMNERSPLADNLDARFIDEQAKAKVQVEKAKEDVKETLLKAKVDPSELLKKFEDTVEDDEMMAEIMSIMEKLLPGISTNDRSQLKLEEIDFSQFDQLSGAIEKYKDEKLKEVKQQLGHMMDQLGDSNADVDAKQKIQQSIDAIDEPALLPRADADSQILLIQQQLDDLKKEKAALIAKGLSSDGLTAMDINLEEMSQTLKKGFDELRGAYLMGAHYVEGKPPHREPLDIIKYRFKKLLAKGESLIGKDFSGVDFTGMDLSGLNLSYCYLEYCNFTHCNLTDTNLESAIATHANFTHTIFTRTNLNKTNLGHSHLNHAFMKEIHATDLVLSKSILEGIQVSQCVFNELNVLEADFQQAHFKECTIPKLNFVHMNLSNSRFENCIMKECTFLQSNMENIVFLHSNLTACNFVECQITHADFSHTIMTNARFPADCTLSYSRFKYATLDHSNFQDVIADHCDFEFSTFNKALFNGANLQYGKFYNSVGKQAHFNKVDLLQADFTSVNMMESSMQKARLTNADLSNSNLYSVNLMGATIGDTNFKGANLDLTILEDWRPS